MNNNKISIFSILSMVLGILAFIFVLISLIGVPIFISLILGVLSIIFGILALVFKDKIPIPIISIILSIFVIIFASILVITLPIINDIKQKINDKQNSANTSIVENTNILESHNTNSIQNNNTIETSESTQIKPTEQRIGNSDYGYVTIPNNWVKFFDPSASSVLQYSYSNVYIVTLFSMDTNQISARDYATSTMYGMKNQNAENVTGATVTLGKYTAYQIYGYYSDENKWLVCWHFEAEDGKTHYISVEGPDASSEYFNIPNTFSINY